jgi:hypothetical protein
MHTRPASVILLRGSDEFVDCSEDGGDDVDVFELLARILASEGFVLVPP